MFKKDLLLVVRHIHDFYKFTYRTDNKIGLLFQGNSNHKMKNSQCWSTKVDWP